ncbi:DUF4065 domain-containing protein [Aliifodinibius sp. S!AR15-10]|uniref:type II TA system antitoxin MqsA family protein n=1 Tax=Aliifodinibius sp. S!AR15-10 TaxID=2950437 RepID=UPI0028581AFB|nr:type II TA system antitoxin MqsA family protein [Aliifodinibius sp. S!AR15-10]MDR8394071.1 DUF4065 domain-containing protein [Aliifodinibius sp. S!AR15-10]
MESPITGGPARLETEQRDLEFRKETFTIKYHYYICEDTGTGFTTDELDEINITQVHNLYRKTHSIPFPEEMRSIREKYGLSARKMSLILEFGENQYNQYENGAMPSLSNARLIQAAKDPEDFLEFLKASNVLEGKALDKKIRQIEKIIYEETTTPNLNLIEYLLGDSRPNEYNGFREPNLERVMNMILFFAEQMSPWETGMNKLMFYSDFTFFKRTCFSISGTEYRAIQYGPVLKKYGAIFEEAEENDFIKIKYDETRYEDSICRQFFPGDKSFNADLFTDDELKTLDDVVSRFEGKKTSEISDISHGEDAWLENNEEKKLINYLHAFDLKAFG